ncbi:MAG: hypothetical protein NE334_12545 [Lentisphaeraceae bacterium]|nr:hypothetical protein [Lentisphaeraceae bacterium]
MYKGTAKNPRNEIKKYQPSDKKAYDLLALFAKPETKKLSYELPIKNICNYFNEDLSNQVHRRPSERYTKDLKLSDPLFQKKGEVIVFKGNKIKQTGIR